MIEAVFQVDDGVIDLEHLLDQFANLFINLVVSQVQRNQVLVVLETLDEVDQSRGVFTVSGQLVGLQVEELQCLVVPQGDSELFRRLRSQVVTFKLKLAQSFVVVEHLGEIHSINICNTFSGQVQACQRAVIADGSGKHTSAGAAELNAGQRVIARGLF